MPGKTILVSGSVICEKQGVYWGQEGEEGNKKEPRTEALFMLIVNYSTVLALPNTLINLCL